MSPTLDHEPVGPAARWAGRILCGLAGLFLLMGGVMSVLRPPEVVESSARFGYPEGVFLPLGLVLIAATVLYLIPRTAVLGAILITGYLGGAVATHVRAGDGLPEVLFPAVFGGVVWLGLYLRDRRLRAIIL